MIIILSSAYPSDEEIIQACKKFICPLKLGQHVTNEGCEGSKCFVLSMKTESVGSVPQTIVRCGLSQEK